MGLVAVNVGFEFGAVVDGPARRMTTQSANSPAMAASEINVRVPIVLIINIPVCRDAVRNPYTKKSLVLPVGLAAAGCRTTGGSA